MGNFTIDQIASQCGITTTNIRSWERYGLISPIKDESGRRGYDMSHVSRIALIINWLSKGVALRDMHKLITGEEIRHRSGWLTWQEDLLAQCRQLNPQKIRALIWRFGREVPPETFVDEIIRPLRLWLNAGKQPELELPRTLLDAAIIEYSTFLLSSSRKAPAGSLLIMALTLSDPVELWLEGIRYCGEGLRVEVLPGAVSKADLTGTKFEHILVWHEKPLTAEQKQWVADSQAAGVPLMLLKACSAPGTDITTSQPLLPPEDQVSVA